MTTEVWYLNSTSQELGYLDTVPMNEVPEGAILCNFRGEAEIIALYRPRISIGRSVYNSKYSNTYLKTHSYICNLTQWYMIDTAFKLRVVIPYPPRSSVDM